MNFLQIVFLSATLRLGIKHRMISSIEVGNVLGRFTFSKSLFSFSEMCFMAESLKRICETLSRDKIQSVSAF